MTPAHRTTPTAPSGLIGKFRIERSQPAREQAPPQKRQDDPAFDHNMLLLGFPTPDKFPVHSKPAARREPTDQQLAIVAHANDPAPTKVKAYAGAGKTSTCEIFAASRKDAGIYLAFSRAIADEASRRFPSNVRTETIHGYALSASGLGAKFTETGKQIGNPTAQNIIQLLGFKGAEAPQRAWRLREVLNQFLASRSHVVEPGHIPTATLAMIERKVRKAEADPVKAISLIGKTVARVVSEANDLWAAMLSPSERGIPVAHDAYLKQWVMSEPDIRTGFILLDEAQDCSPLMCQLIERQKAKVCLVGDPHQAIYGFRGAIDAMNQMSGAEFPLTQSFRFGPVIEMVANAVLCLKGEADMLIGASKHEGALHPSTASISDFLREGPCTALVRSNAEALLLATTHMRKRSVSIVGGVGDVVRIASSAHALHLGRRDAVNHPFLKPFTSWDELLDYREATGDQDAIRIISLVEEHGAKLPELVTDLQARLTAEDRAAVVISTTHKAKGREWDNVFVADDFASPFDSSGNRNASDEELNLLYVAATRARRHLRLNTALEATLSPP